MNNEPPGAAPPAAPKPRKKLRGCLWGCLITLVLLVVLALVAFLVLRGIWKSAIRDYTETAPVELPRVMVPEGTAQDLGERFRNFFETLRSSQSVQPLILTADDINRAIALTGTNQLRDRLFVTIEDGVVKGQVSVPLDTMNIAELRGRFINGTVTLKVDYNGGELRVWADSFQAHGKPAPEWLMKRIRDRNFAEGLLNNQQSYADLQNLETIVVTNGAIILVPKKE
jgi:hypothetical protein